MKMVQDKPQYRAASLFDLTGRTALVTGASRGIAAAIATALAENGARVCMNYSSAADVKSGLPDAAENLCVSLRNRGCDVQLLDTDLSSADAPRELLQGASDLVGDVDILVLSASMQIHKGFGAITASDAERQLNLNLLTPVLIMQAMLPGMFKRRYGRVLTVGSVQEAVPSPEMPIYSATKAAQLNVVQNLAVQCASYGVVVNNLSPGLIETDRNAFKRADAESWAQNVRLANPMRRAGLPSDLVGAALLLCSDAAAFITGANLQVTGGAHVPVPLFDAQRVPEWQST